MRTISPRFPVYLFRGPVIQNRQTLLANSLNISPQLAGLLTAAKRAELTQLTDDVLGEGTADLFSTPAESPLEKRLTEISRKAAVGIEKGGQHRSCSTDAQGRNQRNFE